MKYALGPRAERRAVVWNSSSNRGRDYSLDGAAEPRTNFGFRSPALRNSTALIDGSKGMRIEQVRQCRSFSDGRQGRPDIADWRGLKRTVWPVGGS